MLGVNIAADTQIFFSGSAITATLSLTVLSFRTWCGIC